MPKTLLLDKPAWPFEGSPCVSIPFKQYSRSVVLDPFPCYHHELLLVETTLARAADAFPLGDRLMACVLAHELTSRCNGFAQWQEDYDYDKRVNKDIDFAIVLSGKRIPLHPGMTRYLVAHEYGHCVHAWIEFQRKVLGNGKEVFEHEYAELRGIEFSDKYGGRNWHANTGEILVNDFRIVMCGVEPEFWPHPVPHPLELPRLKYFWLEQKEKFAVLPLAASVNAMTPLPKAPQTA